MIIMNELLDHPLKIHVYDHALILPQKISDSGPKWGLGGLVDADNNFIEHSFYDGGWAKHGGIYTWDQEVYSPEIVVYVGVLGMHWGHFLIDQTNRLWAIPRLLERYENLKFAYLGEQRISGNVLHFFEMLGVHQSQLIHVTKPLRFAKVLIPEQGFKSCEWYSNEFVEMLDLLVDRAVSAVNETSDFRFQENIYFTRRSFAKAVSSEFGEKYFEETFFSNGYKIFSPENISLEEQIYIWNNASKVACVNGTIPLNVMFARNNQLNLIVLNKTSIVHENPYILLKMRNIKADFIDIYKEPFKLYPKSLGEGPYLLWPTVAFKKYCLKHRMIIPINERQEVLFFIIEELKYIWYIIGIKRRLKLILYGLTSEQLRDKIKSLLKYRR